MLRGCERPVERPARRAVIATLGALALMAATLLVPATVAAAGPPFPDPVAGPGRLRLRRHPLAATRSQAEATIDAIEARTGAEVVVYTQVVDYGVTDRGDRGRTPAR